MTVKRVITFYTTADALETEAVMEQYGFTGRLIPIPRSLSAGCGIAWMMETDEYARLTTEVKEQLPEYEQSVEMMIK